MADQRADRNSGPPPDGLAPELRRAVDRIVRQTPPQDLIERALQRARRQVAAERQGRPGRLVRRRMRRATFWSLVAAASIGAVMLAPRYGPILPPPRDVPTAVVPLPREMAAAQDLPTAWAYHEALAQSPEELEALLDRHARHFLRPESPSFQASVFLHSSQPML